MDSIPETRHPSFDLSGRVAVVTGGAGLLGSEFCQTLAGAGARVIVADLDGAAAEKLADRINASTAALRAVPGTPDSLDAAGAPGSSGVRAIAVHVDVTQPASVENMVAAALQNFGRLDILVNSAALDPKFDPEALSQAGKRPSTAFEDFPLEAWNEALGVNLTGAFLSCQAAVVPMLAQGGGVIINLSSIYGLAAPDQRMYQTPGRPPQYKPVYYSVTKAGIIGLTKYLAAYYAGKNIRVNTLSPGGVYNGHDEAFVQAFSARAVLGRMGRKDEMNGALLFLASDASAYMTGANLVVDGGWTTW